MLGSVIFFAEIALQKRRQHKQPHVACPLFGLFEAVHFFRCLEERNTLPHTEWLTWTSPKMAMGRSQSRDALCDIVFSAQVEFCSGRLANRNMQALDTQNEVLRKVSNKTTQSCFSATWCDPYIIDLQSSVLYSTGAVIKKKNMQGIQN